MHTDKQKGLRGFTIIEVLIVLAIAGLMLVVLFLAVPALNRNHRNNIRKNDAIALLNFMVERSNTIRQIPDSCSTRTDPNCFIHNAGLALFNDLEYNIRYTRLTAPNNYGAPDSETTVRVFNFMKCTPDYDWDADNRSVSGGGRLAGPDGASMKNFVVLYYLEVAGGVLPQCVEV